ncbi:MAG: methylamine utilization protein [Pseudomonadota bacterium]
MKNTSTLLRVINGALCPSLLAIALASPAQAVMLVGFIGDKNGQPVKDAVLYANPLDAGKVAAKTSATAAVAQENYSFSPYVSVIRSGTMVSFPNRDGHEHHLKSFSPAKTFELRVSNKRVEPPILFDKAGEVTLVCHFHDWMRGFIYVVDTPYFSKSDSAGNAVLNDLPPGKYEVKAWTANMLTPPLSQTIEVAPSGSTTVKFKFDFVPRPAPVPRAPPKSKGDDAYY